VSWLVIIYSRRLSRQLETRADSIAQVNEGDAGTFARALSRLHEENLLPAVLPTRRHTHPDLYDRLVAAGIEPSYPRPEPPSPNAYHGILFAMLLGVLIVGTLIQYADTSENQSPRPTRSAPSHTLPESRHNKLPLAVRR